MGHVQIDEELCKGCELCGEACPRHLMRLSARINRQGYHPAEFVAPEESNGKSKGCTGCALCGLVCPETAISVYR
ncbi:MAG TPA: ferredoxin family protein [Chloroflexota bacterium]|nr:ferredoxin family protein [Chloroflexota bacterium]